MSVLERFEEKFTKGHKDSCWEWSASLNAGGYGQLNVDGRPIVASRVSWMMYRGEIPAGKNVLHHCDNPKCVNPDHLYIGTQKENAADTVNRKRHHFQKVTHCPSGHPYAGENLRVCNGRRNCRECQRLVDMKRKKWYIREHNEMVAQYGFGEKL